MHKLELNPQKIYSLPKTTHIEKIDHYYLVISPDTANWILVQNENQLEIYKNLASGKSVIDVIQNYPQEQINDVIHILTELEAKNFENKHVNYPQEQGMYIYLTNRCNQRCAHCYMYAGEEKEQELSTLEIKNSAIAHRAFLLYNRDMNHKTSALKNIFSKFFFKYWDQIKFHFNKQRQNDIINNVLAFLNCGNPKFGFSAFVCPKCWDKLIVPFTCKSKFCPSCGVIYAEKWAQSLHAQLFNVKHLHITFSLPTGFIRDFFFKHNFELRALADAAYSSIKYTFKKIGIYQVGVIINIHTFSRDSSWNPHIHAIVTYGGFDINNNWKTPKSLPWIVFRKSWQKCSLDILSSFAKKSQNTNLKNKISLSYKKYHKGFYVNSENFINNIENIAKYLGRYLARPAIAERRIISYNQNFVKFWFQTPDSDKKHYVTLETKNFIGRLVAHIAPKNFKMIRRYGLYSRRAKNRKIKTSSLFNKVLTWAERIYRDFKRNPLFCTKCGTSMELIKIFHHKYGFFFPKLKSFSPP